MRDNPSRATNSPIRTPTNTSFVLPSHCRYASNKSVIADSDGELSKLTTLRVCSRNARLGLMNQIFLTCPHCGVSVGMKLFGRVLTHDMQGVAFAQCNNCSWPVTAILRIFGFIPQQWVDQKGDIIDKKDVQIIHVFPKRAITAAPEHIDAGVANIFVQSENARKRGDRHVAGMGFRKTLDIALKLFDATVKVTFIAASIF
jgi:hypothetical protein